MEKKSVKRSCVTSTFSDVGMNPNRFFSFVEVNKQECKPSVKHLGSLTSMWNEFAAYLNKKQIHTGGNEASMSGSENHAVILKDFAGFLVEIGCVPHEEASDTLKFLSTALKVCAIDDYWIINSGATDHMINKFTALHDFEEMSLPSKVSIANGKCVSVLGKRKN